jgi:hypothetical protein
MDAITESYTWDDLKRGKGLFASGDWTVIYEAMDGRFITADCSQRPAKGSGLRIVGGGRLEKNQVILRDDDGAHVYPR